MKITKFGHCCLLIEQKELRILTDPGAYSDAQNSAQNLDVVLITHEHADHLHIESLKKVILNNPDIRVFTNPSVGEILKKESIAHEIFENSRALNFKGVEILCFLAPHEFISDSVPLPENTALLIDGELLFPGDAFFIPKKEVRVLALPVAGPWMKLKEAIEYAKKVNPKKTFPVHDGMLKIIGPVHKVPQKELMDVGIEFVPLEAGQSAEF